MFDEAFGLPAHPLVIHAPIVLLPIAAIVTLVLAWKADWRRRAGWWPTIALVVIVGMLFAATQSGEALDEQLGGVVGEHEELGEQTLFITVGWLLVTAGLAFRDRQVGAGARALSADAATRPGLDPIATGLAVVGAVMAVVATVWLVRTGHSGADSHWSLYVA